MRKAQDDVMARTAAERLLGDRMEAEGLIDSSAIEPTEAGNRLLAEIEAVEFEQTVSKVRGGIEVPLRRLVITTNWEVDPAGK